MKNFFSWSAWSITTKILTLFLGLSVVSITVVGILAIITIRDLGTYALETTTLVGEQAIQDSTTHLNQLGEEVIKQKAADIARQVEMYLAAQNGMTPAEMQSDDEFRKIAVQPVGTNGYTTIIDPRRHLIIVHKFTQQEKDLSTLQTLIPSFWSLLEASAANTSIAGYYNWLEIDGAITQKFASIVSIKNPGGEALSLWATTYITDFSMPAEQTRQEIYTAIDDSKRYINDIVTDIRDWFVVLFTALVMFVIGVGLLFSRVITQPIQNLKRGADIIAQGELGYQIKVNSRDELGQLADSFNQMSSALSASTVAIKTNAAENITREREIQDILRLYLRQINQAQEAERKRIARELHDDTAQALVVIARQLDDLAAGNPAVTVRDVRQRLQQTLDNVRRFSQELRPSILDDLGLIPAVKSLAADLEKNFGIKTTLLVNGAPRSLSPEAELMLFRIVQEALTNVRKHSQSKIAEIILDFTENELHLRIKDKGIGFEKPAQTSDFTKMSKLGLVGIEERVQLLGGALEIESQTGRGTALSIRLPM